MGFSDWKKQGIWPCQDHEEGVPVSRRMTLVGGRISLRPEPTQQGVSGVIEYAREDGKGTLGDIHPWVFWQTKDRGLRGMGSWSMAWSAMVTGGTTGGSKGGFTGTPVTPAEVHPINDSELTYDPRYGKKVPGWPDSFPSLPHSTMTMVMGGTKEDTAEQFLLHADPRIIAPNVKGPGECGTLVCDLQPTAEVCMGDSKTPGVGGRHSRIQSMMRVVAMDRKASLAIGASPGNSVAWNLARSGVDKLAGYGMVFAEMDTGDQEPVVTKPITPRPQSLITGPESGGLFVGGGGESGGEGKTPDQFGKFAKDPEDKHGVSFMAHTVSGPFHPGSAGDKHLIGKDADGHPMVSGHLDVDAYFYRDANKDGPLLFEDEDYSDPEPLPLRSRVHLVWDGDEIHDWFKGPKDGKWRWEAEVPYHVPVITGDPPVITNPRKPITGGPPRPGRPGPITPAPPGPGNPPGSKPITPRVIDPSKPITGRRTPRSGLEGGPRGGNGPAGGPERGGQGASIAVVGQTQTSDGRLFEILHPIQEAFAAMSWRPQFMASGATSFIHNAEVDREELRVDEWFRPQVLTGRAWGAQVGAEWDYADAPHESRARSGTASGGILMAPPEFEMEDYFGIHSVEDVRAPSTTSYLTVAPGVGFALGTPNIDGGLQAKSVTVTQTAAAGTNDPLSIGILGSDRAAVEAIGAELDQTSGELVVDVGTGGTQAMRVPAGTTDQRPSAISPSAGMIRVNTDAFGSGADALEFYDAQQAIWITLNQNPFAVPTVSVPFTASNSYSYFHGLGRQPSVSVLDSNGVEIITNVQHVDNNQVTLQFYGTLTSHTLLLGQ